MNMKNLLSAAVVLLILQISTSSRGEEAVSPALKRIIAILVQNNNKISTDFQALKLSTEDKLQAMKTRYNTLN